jgi:hypothetical protein
LTTPNGFQPATRAPERRAFFDLQRRIVQLEEQAEQAATAAQVAAAPWVTTFSPVITQGVAMTMTSGFSTYQRVGPSVCFQGTRDVASGVGTASTVFDMTTPLPVKNPHPHRPIGTAVLIDASAGLIYRMLVIPVSAITVRFFGTHTITPGYMGGVDFTAALAVGDRLAWDMQYETT